MTFKHHIHDSFSSTDDNNSVYIIPFYSGEILQDTEIRIYPQQFQPEHIVSIVEQQHHKQGIQAYRYLNMRS